jgi:ribose 5-phosphate isomerase A
MARGLVARALVRHGGRPVWRQDFVTDNGNLILDVHDLSIIEPARVESELDHLTGTVCNGLFARRGADVLLVATDGGVDTL